MAASKLTFLDIVLAKTLRGFADLENDALALVLTTKAQPLTPAFTGASGNALYDDLTAEVTGAGYTEGGKIITGQTVSYSGPVATLAFDSVTWAAATFVAKYAVLCKADSTGVLGEIVAFSDLETTDEDGRTSSGGDFIINFVPSALTLTRQD